MNESLYHLLLIYEGIPANRKTYTVNLDGESETEIGGDVSYLNYKILPGWHSISFSGYWGTEKTERFFVNENQYITRMFLQLNASSKLEIRMDFGSSYLVERAMNRPEEEETPPAEEAPRAQPAAQTQPRRRATGVVWWILGLILAYLAGALSMVLAYNILRPSQSPSQNRSTATTQQQTQRPAATPSSAADETGAVRLRGTVPPGGRSSGTLGNYQVEILSAVLDRDEFGIPVIVVTYNWTNYSAASVRPSSTVLERAFQDNLPLSPVSMNGMLSSSETGLRDVRPGATVQIQTAFALSDQRSVVEFELAAVPGGGSSVIGMNFELRRQ